MRLIDVIETIWLDKLPLDNSHKNFIVDYFTDKEWTKTCELFLKGIGSNHTIPGTLIYKLQDFISQYYHNGTLTRDQKWLLLHTAVENWNQINLITRIEMNL